MWVCVEGAERGAEGEREGAGAALQGGRGAGAPAHSGPHRTGQLTGLPGLARGAIRVDVNTPEL